MKNPQCCPPNITSYNCEICQYITANKKDYSKHTRTAKHLKKVKLNTLNSLMPENPQLLFKCKKCNKEYKARNSLWYHEKKCNAEVLHEENNEFVDEYDMENKENKEDTEMATTNEMDMQSTIVELLKQNQEFQKQIIELMKENIGNTTNITNNNITQNNNKFNLNVFLNETCKDALNLSDFLESLILTLTDFENFGPLGYCGGISNILIKGLSQLDISKRPIHCSDLKREVIHIKNNDTWHKDDDKQQMIKAIKAIEHKNVKQMNLWAKANPEYKDPNHKKSDLYTKLIDQSLGETDKEKALKNYNKIIRTVAKEILVDK
uniref:C2H2-type domain-containing protein n=1 Tax=viral metagenome TaxID=1070528 RepID=A0A6C0DFG4_9ZZZZ